MIYVSRSKINKSSLYLDVMRNKIILAALAAVITATMITPQTFAANNQEQIIFSGAATGSFGTPSVAGLAYFWIWCKNTAGPNGHTYSTDCEGSMSFPALGITKGVNGEDGITEPSEGTYVIHVQSRTDNGKSVDCTLTNVPPITSGPTNTVKVSCVSLLTLGSGITNSAVVISTGPG